MNYSINSAQGRKEAFIKDRKWGRKALCLLCFITKAFLFTPGQNQSLIKYSIMETAYIRMHFITHLPMVANSFYNSKFTARYGDRSTVLHFEDDYL